MTGFTGKFSNKYFGSQHIRFIIGRLRTLITLYAMIIITWFILTIDPEGEENALDLVKDFTALAVIVEIDTMILGFTDIKYD